MQDARFNQLYAAWRTAEDALAAYIAATVDDVDPAVRRVVVQQLRSVALKRYGTLCRHVSAFRRKLRLL